MTERPRRNPSEPPMSAKNSNSLKMFQHKYCGITHLRIEMCHSSIAPRDLSPSSKCSKYRLLNMVHHQDSAACDS